MSPQCECCTDATPRLCLSCNDLDVRQAAAKERARIRRLIGPALKKLHVLFVKHAMVADECQSCRLVTVIDAATKRESKRKARK